MRSEIQELVDKAMIDVVRDMRNATTNLEKVGAEISKIYEALIGEGVDPDDLHFYLSRWGRSVSITGVKSEEDFKNIVIALTGMYGEGEKSKTWDNQVRYSYKSDKEVYANNVDVDFSADTKITGCKLVTEYVHVPRKVVEAHDEEKITVKCD